MDKALKLRYLIKCAEKEANAKLNKTLSSIGITANQSEVLTVLFNYEPLSLKELGDLLICERKSPSRLVQKLVDKELVYKSQSLEDSRKTVLHLTKMGRNLIPKINQLEAEFNATLHKAFGDEQLMDDFAIVVSNYIKNTESEEKIQRRFEDR